MQLIFALTLALGNPPQPYVVLAAILSRELGCPPGLEWSVQDDEGRREGGQHGRGDPIDLEHGGYGAVVRGHRERGEDGREGEVGSRDVYQPCDALFLVPPLPRLLNRRQVRQQL